MESSGASGTPPEGEMTRGNEEARVTAEVVVEEATAWLSVGADCVVADCVIMASGSQLEVVEGVSVVGAED